MSRSRTLVFGVVVVIVLLTVLSTAVHSNDSDLWGNYQGAMVQTIQTRYCQQFLNNYVNFKSVGVSSYGEVHIPSVKNVANIAGNEGAQIMQALQNPIVSNGKSPLFGFLFRGPNVAHLEEPYKRLNTAHEEWAEMLRFVQQKHPNGHLGFSPTTDNVPGVSLAPLYSFKRNPMSNDQRRNREISWATQGTATSFLVNGKQSGCVSMLCIFFNRKSPICGPQVAPDQYLDASYPNENVEFWTTSTAAEFEEEKKNPCTSGPTHIGYVLTSNLPNTVPLYRISFSNLFIYTTDPSAPQHFNSRNSGYSVTTIGFLYKEWPCSVSMGSTSVTQVVTEPMMAVWSAKNMCPLYETLAFTYPKSSVAFLPDLSGHDHLYASRYMEMIQRLSSVRPEAKNAAAAAFARFQKGSVTCDGTQSFPWKVVGASLEEFVSSAKSGNGRVTISIDRVSGSSTYGPISSEGFKGGIFFFGFYRMAETKQQPINVKKDHFSMTFEAQGFVGIKVTPGDWMDLEFVRTHAADLKRLGFFGPNGKLPLTPRIVWVAYKPVVSITLKSTEIQKIVSTFSDPTTAAISIGGIRFSSHSVNSAMDDHDGGQFHRESVPDTVTLSEPRLPDTANVEGNDNKEDDDDDDMILDSVLELVFDEVYTEYDVQDDDSMSEISPLIFALLLRRQKDQVVVQPSQEKELIQTARFQSNSEDAVIVGITSEDTESIGHAFNW